MDKISIHTSIHTRNFKNKFLNCITLFGNEISQRYKAIATNHHASTTTSTRSRAIRKCP